ncbi:GNAT family N-acetyltransferase [Microbacterium foliorum]|uniref:GNAT family N-acetyltransferase n=1 Tax=Microbacterium foliorum TaxID=104336 RepID=UPI001D283711|nr:GNAT family N-acetyltransferase [Microbacterium foliorum]CAH0228620.1 L-methionine sulfoximine/L-methionine sulfone acetyltransferase [Microbacterium foliorum]CAH0234200.1 L-methionine sulfoximine/L-methionine sulfone acetyltransferase [Microbacterium foliorum]
MSAHQIRDAETADLEAILAIYNDAVLRTTAIWNDDAVDLADRTAWMAERTARGYPVLVAVDDTGDGTGVLGYATFGDFRPHHGFRHTVEHSVYVRDGERGRGIGRALMVELIDRARRLGVHVMVAAVESGNTGSVIMHKRLDFLQVGRMPQVGAKFDRWLDLTLLQLVLDGRPFPDELS